MNTPPRRSWASTDELLEDWADISARAAPARMVRSRRISLAAAAVSGLSLAVLVVVGLAVVGLANRPSPQAPAGGGPRIVPLPTHPVVSIPPGAAGGCPDALATGILAGDPDDAEVAWLLGSDGARHRILWPTGYSARFDPALELIGPGGVVVAREGDRLELGGGVGADGRFDACGQIGVVSATLLPEPAPTPTPEPAAGPATWRLSPDEAPTSDSRTIRVLLTERACASGRSPEGRVLEPQIEYRVDAIFITLRVRSRAGAQECPGNPEYPLMIELGEPLGDRALVDGTEAAIRWPVSDN